jgi:hypothetical protein
MRLRLRQTDLAEVRLRDLRATRDAGHGRLHLNLEVFVREWKEAPATLFSFGGYLAVLGGTAGQLRIGSLVESSPPILLRTESHSQAQSFSLDVPIDRSILHAIEDHRSGGDLRLKLWMTLVALQDGQLVSITDGEEWPLSKGVWVELLNVLGYSQTIILEIALSTSNPRMQRAAQSLTLAQNALHNGDYRDAVGRCREVLEAIAHAVGGDENSVSFDNSRKHSKDQRLLLIRRAVRSLPHAAKHLLPEEKEIQWQRADAQMLITMTASVLNFYSSSL